MSPETRTVLKRLGVLALVAYLMVIVIGASLKDSPCNHADTYRAASDAGKC